jgi:dipeptidyl aminopeptidase/acylaminoacyl peptidase
MCFSPDGSLLASHDAKGASELGNFPSRERVIRLREAATGKLRRQIDLGDRGNGMPAFSPNGRMLGIAGKDGEIRLWEVATGKERRLFKGHNAPITTLTFSPDGKSLASGSDDTTALLWDTYARPKAGKPESLDYLWTKLSSDDAAQAFAAMTTLIHMPDETVNYMNRHLTPIRAPDAKRIDALIADLASEHFGATRDASNELAKLGDLAEPGLNHALAQQPSLETRQRIESLLAKLDNVQGGDTMRAVRAVEVLEALGTPAACAHIQTLGKGAPGHRLTRAAEEALRRR